MQVVVSDFLISGNKIDILTGILEMPLRLKRGEPVGPISKNMTTHLVNYFDRYLSRRDALLNLSWKL